LSSRFGQGMEEWVRQEEKKQRRKPIVYKKHIKV
jgi:hypothetical protein